MQTSEADAIRLWKSCPNLEYLNIREMRMFNPHLANPFRGLSEHLRHFRLGFPRDGAEIRDDVETGLFEALSQLPSLESVHLDKFSCHAPIVGQFTAVHHKIRVISFQCKTNRHFLEVARVVKHLRFLEHLTLEFPQLSPQERLDPDYVRDDVTLPSHVDFSYHGRSLRIRGEASPEILGFIIRPPYSLRSLEVGMETLGKTLLERGDLVTPGISKLEELILQVNYPEHEDRLGPLLAKSAALKKLHILVADQTGWLFRSAYNYLREHEARGVAEGPKTFDFVIDFVRESPTIEEVDLSIATPLPYQLNANRFSVSEIKDKLLQLKDDNRASRLKCLNVGVAMINESPWKMQIIKDCLGVWRHHLPS